MKTFSSIRFRLTALGVTTAVMAGFLVAFTWVLQHKADSMHDSLSFMDSESFRIEDHFKDKLRFANDEMRRFGTTENPAAWEEFQKASQELKSWIEAEGQRLTTDGEKRIVKEMEATWATYMDQARIVHAVAATNGILGVTLREYSSFTDQGRHFVDLGRDLARAHFQTRNLALDQAHHLLTWVRQAMLLMVGLLFLSGVGLAATVYRSLIAPLRLRLAESQAEAQRNEKLASLGVLAAGVAHEIRNPLTAIKTAVFSQQKRLAPGSTPHGDGEIIEREISRLEGIVTEFLQFARPAQPALVPIFAEEPLREVQALMAPQLVPAGIRLVGPEDSTQGPTNGGPALAIRADPSQLKQVLINLVQNAAESIEHDGTIWLRAEPARQRLGNGEREAVVLEVADNGKGIPLEAQKRLFDPFFTTKVKGTGLGLAIAARIVELHGGALQYQTQPDHGSTFRILLPRCPTVEGE